MLPQTQAATWTTVTLLTTAYLAAVPTLGGGFLADWGLVKVPDVGRLGNISSPPALAMAAAAAELALPITCKHNDIIRLWTQC